GGRLHPPHERTPRARLHWPAGRRPRASPRHRHRGCRPGGRTIEGYRSSVTEPRTATPLFNIANALTLLRIVLVPVFVVLMVASRMTEPGYRIGAAFAFGIASLTDFADGWLARMLNQVTSFGQVADPIADKVLTGAALVLLSFYDTLP